MRWPRVALGHVRTDSEAAAGSSGWARDRMAARWSHGPPALLGILESTVTVTVTVTARGRDEGRDTRGAGRAHARWLGMGEAGL